MILSAYCSAARERFTRLAIWRAACTVRGSNSSALKVACQAYTPLPSSTASRMKVRQNRLSAMRLYSGSGFLGLWDEPRKVEAPPPPDCAV